MCKPNSSSSWPSFTGSSSSSLWFSLFLNTSSSTLSPISGTANEDDFRTYSFKFAHPLTEVGFFPVNFRKVLRSGVT